MFLRWKLHRSIGIIPQDRCRGRQARKALMYTLPAMDLAHYHSTEHIILPWRPLILRTRRRPLSLHPVNAQGNETQVRPVQNF